MALVLEPFPYAQLILGGTQKARLVASVVVALATGFSMEGEGTDSCRALTS